ncbi:MAG: outer membrane protein assembly factor BamA, partial [Cytophagia bacterium]|nr:outer membrane protein assembly factor BamA [Cytophagia bacterium]
MRKVLVITCLLIFTVGSALSQVRYGVNAGEGVQIDYSNPKVFEIADIKYTGLTVLDERALTSFAGIKVGDRVGIPGRQVSEAIKKLWNQGIIADVQFWLTKTEGDRAFIEVRITERPRILKYDITGIGSGQVSELKEQLGVIGKVASAPLIKNSELVIKKYFIEKGFLNVTVKTEQQADSVMTDGVSLNFVVDRRSKVKINKIEFEGNEAADDGRLKKAMRNTKEKPRFWLVNRLFEQVFNTRPNT